MHTYITWYGKKYKIRDIWWFGGASSPIQNRESTNKNQYKIEFTSTYIAKATCTFTNKTNVLLTILDSSESIQKYLKCYLRVQAGLGWRVDWLGVWLLAWMWAMGGLWRFNYPGTIRDLGWPDWLGWDGLNWLGWPGSPSSSHSQNQYVVCSIKTNTFQSFWWFGVQGWPVQNR